MTTTTIAELADQERLDDLAVCAAVRAVTGLSLMDPREPEEPWPALAFHQPVTLTQEQLEDVLALAAPAD